jgi:DNA-binding NarL/FixJ family response regulator
MTKSRLLLVDDHQVVRQGLRDALGRPADLYIVAEADDGLTAERLARTGGADLMIIDIALPRKRGIEVLNALRADGIMLPVLFFSMYPASQYADFVRRAGAQGYVSKDADMAVLLHAIRRILNGGSSFPSGHRAPACGHAEGDPLRSLSRREFEVFQGLIAGTGVQDMAAGFGITPQSVTTYRRRLLDKLGVASNAELVVLASRHGYL